MKVPCSKNCPDRSVTCHSTCKEYLDFLKENELRKKRQYKDHTIDHALAEIKKGRFK